MRSIILIALAVTTVVALSKSDGEAKIRAEQEELKREMKEKQAQQHKTIGKAMRMASSEPLEFRPRALTKDFILEDHMETFDGQRKFPNMPVMAYVTPWNNAGYDRAVRLARSLAIVAPVWLQLKPDQDENGRLSCKITGTHDIDQGWIEKLRTANPDIKILPRLIIEEFTSAQIKDVFSRETATAQCVRMAVDLVESADFDGLVLEGWLPMLRAAAEARFDLINGLETMAAFGKALHANGRMMVMSIPAPVDGTLTLQTSLWADEYWDVLGDSVDYVQIMTHDFHTADNRAKMFPQAPVRWVESNLRAVIGQHGEYANRVMLGLYHYGFKTDFASRTQGAVMAKDFLEALSDEDAELEWESEVQEHYVRLGQMTMFFPTVSSLEIRARIAAEYGSAASIWDLGQGLEHFSRIL